MQGSSILRSLHSEQRTWQLHAACGDMESALFFEDLPESNVIVAKSICRRCPVVGDCLDFAVDADEQFGIWGGLTAEERVRERWKLQAQRKRPTLYTEDIGWASCQ